MCEKMKRGENHQIKDWVRALLSGLWQKANGAEWHKRWFLVTLSYAGTMLFFSVLLWNQVWRQYVLLSVRRRRCVVNVCFLVREAFFASDKNNLSFSSLFTSICMCAYFLCIYFKQYREILGSCHGNSHLSPPLPSSLTLWNLPGLNHTCARDAVVAKITVG